MRKQKTINKFLLKKWVFCSTHAITMFTVILLRHLHQGLCILSMFKGVIKHDIIDFKTLMSLSLSLSRVLFLIEGLFILLWSLCSCPLSPFLQDLASSWQARSKASTFHVLCQYILVFFLLFFSKRIRDLNANRLLNIFKWASGWYKHLFKISNYGWNNSTASSFSWLNMSHCWHCLTTRRGTSKVLLRSLSSPVTFLRPGSTRMSVSSSRFSSSSSWRYGLC